MPDPSDSPNPASSADSVYDAYLEAALAGNAEEPAAFLARFPGLSVDELDELLERLRAIGALVVPAAKPAILVDDESGETLGQIGEYRLLRRLGGGAMGDVFLAEQTSLGRLVALKTQRADLAASPKAMARFEREAQALAQVTHQSVVGVHGFGREGELRYLVMELLPGRSLKELLDEPRAGEPRPSPVQIARWGVELAKGLQAVHQAGLLHRDVKPSNVRISETGHAVLVDFGLAKLSSMSELSRTGEFVGSPAYAAPEQVQGVDDLDARADIYGLGAALYHALAGRPPIVGESIESVLHAVLHRDPPALRSLNPALPRDLELVCAKALEKSRERRYASAEAFAQDLKAVLELRPVTAKPVGLPGRAMRWARRNALAASSLSLALSTMLVALVVFAWKAHEQDRQRIAQAHTYLEEARTTIASYRADRLALIDEEADFDQLYRLQEYEHLSDAQTSRLRELEGRVRSAREQRDDAYRSVGNLLDQAAELDPTLDSQINAAWSALLVERIVEAEDRGDLTAREFFASEIERRDPDGSFRAAAYPFARVTVKAAASGARAWLFRYVDLDALPADFALDESREVPVPVAPGERQRSELVSFEPPVPWGTEVLRVERDLGALRAGDVLLDVEGRSFGGGPLVVAAVGTDALKVGDRLTRFNGQTLRDGWDYFLERSVATGPFDVLEFETADGPYELRVPVGTDPGILISDVEEWASIGGQTARVFSGGHVRDVVLPPNAELRPTAAPVYLAPQAEVELGTELVLQPGRYLIVATAPDRILQRMYLEPRKAGQHVIDLDLPALDSAPSGFVPVRTPLSNIKLVFVGETEVTALEYLAFLNDPETLRRIDAAAERGVRTLYPRASLDDGSWGMWDREDGGRFQLPSDWPEAWPAIGVTYRDVQAYCEWRNQTNSAGGEFRLLSSAEFFAAGSGDYDRMYSWGDRFDQRFANTCFSRRIARPAPVMTNPRDESPFGIYDACGNASEWLEDWFDQGRELRISAGGAWGQAQIRDLGVLGQRGLGMDNCGGETGFRIAWQPEPSE